VNENVKQEIYGKDSPKKSGMFMNELLLFIDVII
jgi:hypothetical protein